MPDNREIVYVRDEDKPKWAAARRVAKRKRISLSRLVNDALEAHVPEVAAEPAPTPPDWSGIAAEPETCTA